MRDIHPRFSSPGVSLRAGRDEWTPDMNNLLVPPFSPFSMPPFKHIPSNEIEELAESA
jgi:hypothetical protein